jgi:hypothetical protein
MRQETTAASEMTSTMIDNEDVRVAIAVMFVKILDAPPEEEWSGVDGTAAAVINGI